LIVELPIEGSVTAYIAVETFEEELRLALELETRGHILCEIGEAIVRLLDVLEDRARGLDDRGVP
jgi:hypothetical protein